MLNADTAIAVHIVREALANIDELIEQSAGTIAGVDTAWLRNEAHQTTMGLIASLITADGFLHPNEKAFLENILELGDRQNADLAFLREYTERWRSYERTVPAFFRRAVEADVKNRTDTARSMMREIQLIANNCAVTDGKFAACEVKIIQDYLRLLDDFVERETGGSSSWLEP